MIKLYQPSIDQKERLAVNDVLVSGVWASGSNPIQVAEFEKEFGEYTKFNHVIAVNSGTAALHLALSYYDIKNKEVILPALSFVSTANAILYNGGIPVFADVLEETLCLDPMDVNEKFTDKTGMIIPVNFGGIQASEHFYHDTPIVCDSAHRVGRWSNNDMTCYSFHPTKNIAMPTGGAIAFNGSLDKLKPKRFCGITDRTEAGYDVKELGWNYYMNEISACIGREQLKKQDDFQTERRLMAKIYNEKLEVPCMPYRDDSSYHLFWIRVKNRDEFRFNMKEEGIETGTHYTPIHYFSLYRDYFNELPVTEKVMKEIVTIPIHNKLSLDDVDKIITSVNSL